MSFVEKLDPTSLEVFNKVCKKPFSDQAQFVLNAFWAELQDQAQFIYNHTWEHIKKVDMDNKSIQYVHLYQEGADLDFDMALRLFEVQRYWFEDKKNAALAEQYKRSNPGDETAIVRKKTIREKIDVNFDSRVSLIEYLLYIYALSPKDLMDRSKGGDEPPEVTAAKTALAEVQAKVNEYEALRTRLMEESNLPGVKGLKAKNELAQLDSSPLAEELRKLLITAEAKVRIAIRKFGAGSGEGGAAPTQGTIWWLQTDLDAKKAKYGPKSR